jgi:hypothetical protein
MKILKKLMNLLWVDKNAYACLLYLANAHVPRNDCFILANYNDWPRWQDLNNLHFVQFIFSHSWVRIWEKLNNAH